MATKPTPGPWRARIEQCGGAWFAEIDGPGRERLAELRTSTSDTFTKEDAANAHLIAAAPDLLKALEEVRDCQRCAEDYGRCVACDQRIKTAIAKAQPPATETPQSETAR